MTLLCRNYTEVVIYQQNSTRIIDRYDVITNKKEIISPVDAVVLLGSSGDDLTLAFGDKLGKKLHTSI